MLWDRERFEIDLERIKELNVSGVKCKVEEFIERYCEDPTKLPADETEKIKTIKRFLKKFDIEFAIADSEDGTYIYIKL